MVPAGHPSRGQPKKQKPASRSTQRKSVVKGNPASKKKPESSSAPVATTSHQTSGTSFGDFIFLSDSDYDEQPQTLPPRSPQNSANNFDSDCIQLISSPAVIGSAATSSSTKRMGNRRGKGRRGGLNASNVLKNSASANQQLVIGALNSQMGNSLDSVVNIQQSSSIASGPSRAPSSRKKTKKSKKRLQKQIESDDSLSSDSNCILGMSPRRKHKNSHKGADKGKKITKNTNQKSSAANKQNAAANCDSDSWSYDSSNDQVKIDDTSNQNKNQNDATASGSNATSKPKVSTNWSDDDEDLQDIKVLPEAAIFTNRIESYKERMKELKTKEWLAKESLIEELTRNTKVSTAPSKKRGKKKVPDKEKSSVSSDDSEAELAAKMPVVAPPSASNSDDDEYKVKLDETITEAHISKTVRNRIERKINRMREEQKEMFAIPTIYASDDEDEDLQCLSDSEVNTEIEVKVRWQHKLMKIPIKLNETFTKVFNEVAQKNGLEASNIMLFLRDKIVALDDTPKSLNVTTYDIFDSCIWDAREGASDTTAKTHYVQVKMQSNDSKVKLPLTIHKLEPMSVVMKEYSTKRNIPLEKMIFKFDGEKIDPNSTPFDLDMEDESCIDVKIT